MWDNLAGRLGGLPGAALVFPGHEYAVDSLRFAAFIEPADEAVGGRVAWAERVSVSPGEEALG